MSSENTKIKVDAANGVLGELAEGLKLKGRSYCFDRTDCYCLIQRSRKYD